MAKKDKKSEKPEDALYGSSIQPSVFDLDDGSTLQLGYVVRQAYDESNAETFEEWNALPDEEREALIQAVVDKLSLKKDEPKAEAPDLTGLVKMHKDGKYIHAHPTVVEHHKSNGWKPA